MKNKDIHACYTNKDTAIIFSEESRRDAEQIPGQNARNGPFVPMIAYRELGRRGGEILPSDR